MTVDVAAMRAELAELTARRVNEITTPSRTCPSHASLLHRVASLITTEDLPPARVTVTTAAEVLVDATGERLVQNVVRRWCAALGLVVTETPGEMHGFASVSWTGSGYHEAIWWMVQGHELLPTEITDRFGVGLVAE
jgi:hypothetical protein